MTLIQLFREQTDLVYLALMSFEENFYVNVALFRPATQSSLLRSPFFADKSVDGNTGGTASSTAFHDQSPWWKVQLAHRIWVSQVEIFWHTG